MPESQAWGTHSTWRNDREEYLMRYSLGRTVLYSGVLGGGGGKEWKGDVAGRGRHAITYVGLHHKKRVSQGVTCEAKG